MRFTPGFGSIVDLLFPPRCPACETRVARPDFCPPCRARIPPIAAPFCPLCGVPFAGPGPGHLCARCVSRRPRFSLARACAAYEPQTPNPLIEVLQRLKYRRDVSVAKILAAYMTERLPLAIDHDLIVPVPLHRQRLRWRGFNQSVVLARAVGRAVRRPVDPLVLARVRATPPQVGLGLPERRRNVRRAFAVRRPEALRGRRVLLVDDVMTTGATADDCARSLRHSGARQVDVLVLARALDHP
jgi:ComF family protein